jgi:hypothetical protein
MMGVTMAEFMPRTDDRPRERRQGREGLEQGRGGCRREGLRASGREGEPAPEPERGWLNSAV